MDTCYFCPTHAGYFVAISQFHFFFFFYVSVSFSTNPQETCTWYCLLKHECACKCIVWDSQVSSRILTENPYSLLKLYLPYTAERFWNTQKYSSIEPEETVDKNDCRVSRRIHKCVNDNSSNDSVLQRQRWIKWSVDIEMIRPLYMYNFATLNQRLIRNMYDVQIQHQIWIFIWYDM